MLLNFMQIDNYYLHFLAFLKISYTLFSTKIVCIFLTKFGRINFLWLPCQKICKTNKSHQTQLKQLRNFSILIMTKVTNPTALIIDHGAQIF